MLRFIPILPTVVNMTKITLGKNELKALCQKALSAATEAGNLISKQGKQQIIVKHKTNSGSLSSKVVTQVDHLSQKIIIEALFSTCQKYDLALLSEEEKDTKERLEKNYYWCIDPLDGTLPFIKSTPGYSVSIALVSRYSTPLIGVIYDPVTQNLYHAIKDGGAFKNKLPWTGSHSPTSDKQTLTLHIDKSFKQHSLYEKTLAEIKKIAEILGYSNIRLISHGGAVMNACWTIENQPACYFKFPRSTNSGGSLWDYAATCCIFNELKMPCSDIKGNPMELNRPDSTYMNHKGILYASDIRLAECIKNMYYTLMPMSPF